MTLIQSRMHRDEFMRWILIVTLALWCSVASILALRNRDKTLLITINDGTARVVHNSEIDLLHAEQIEFVKEFANLYLTFDSDTYEKQIGKASDLMSSELWNSVKEHHLKILGRLKTESLRQTSLIDTIDSVGDNRFEVVSTVNVKTKLEERSVTVKLRISLGPNERSETNPWRFQITEVSDELH